MGCDCKKRKKIEKEALKVLGKDNFVLIMHGGSFPSRKGEDTGFGSMNSNAAKDIIDMSEGLFDAIQLGPAGKTKSSDSSPYTGTIFSGNPLFIDLKQLTTKEWNNILSEETFNKVVENNPNKDKGRTAYSYIYKAQNDALKEAWENFKNGKKLHKEFEKFKKEKSFWLNNDALYEALSIENGNDYYPNWNSELDRNLLNPKTPDEKAQAEKRISEIEDKYKDEIDFYKFCQFVLDRQLEETKKYAKKHHIKMIADRQVAFSDRDAWAYQSLFLPGWCLGCPPDYFSKNGQAWGFPVMDPEQMFNEDGSLGKGGKLMKRLYEKMFKENPGGVRIDHIVGLIDPWVYKSGKNPKVEEGAGRLYSSPKHPELSKYAIATADDVNEELEPDKEEYIKTLNHKQVKLYGRFIEKIVIAAAKECGLNKNAIVCEDLGTLTKPVEEVMKEYKLQGMRLTQFVKPDKPNHPYRCKNIEEHVWAMVGTHDNEPISFWARDMVETEIGYEHVKNLVADLYPEVTDKEEKDKLIWDLTHDAELLKKVKLSEIFACKAKNIQIFFTDFFGIDDVYNKPGTSGDENWSLRLPNDYAERKPINLNEILTMAIKARGSKFAKKHHKLLEKLAD